MIDFLGFYGRYIIYTEISVITYLTVEIGQGITEFIRHESTDYLGRK
jgi:hypothetical protein